MLMIDPCRLADTIAFATDCAQKNEPFRLTSRTWSQSRSIISKKGTRGNTPALLIRTLIGPRPSWAADTIACTCSIRATSALTKIAPPTAGAHLFGYTLGSTIVIKPVDRYVGASGSKFQRHRAADALLRPRDQNHLARELHV